MRCPQDYPEFHNLLEGIIELSKAIIVKVIIYYNEKIQTNSTGKGHMATRTSNALFMGVQNHATTLEKGSFLLGLNIH